MGITSGARTTDSQSSFDVLSSFYYILFPMLFTRLFFNALKRVRIKSLDFHVLLDVQCIIVSITNNSNLETSSSNSILGSQNYSNDFLDTGFCLVY